MADFKSLIISVILIGIFLVSLVNFGGQLAIDNNATRSILDDDRINRTFVNVSAALNSTALVAETQRESFFKSIPIVGEITLIIESLTGILRVFFTTTTGFYNLFFITITETLGIPQIFLTALATVVLVLLILAAWRVSRSGS